MKDVGIIEVTVDADIIMGMATEITASVSKAAAFLLGVVVMECAAECHLGAHQEHGVSNAVKAIANLAVVNSAAWHHGAVVSECVAECHHGADLKDADSACHTECPHGARHRHGLVSSIKKTAIHPKDKCRNTKAECLHRTDLRHGAARCHIITKAAKLPKEINPSLKARKMAR